MFFAQTQLNAEALRGSKIGSETSQNFERVLQPFVIDSFSFKRNEKTVLDLIGPECRSDETLP